MISHKNRFILITPQKTSSTTIVTALKDYIVIKDRQIPGNAGGVIAPVNVKSDCFDYGDEFNANYAKHTALHIYYDGWNTVKALKQLGCLPDEDKMGSIKDYFKAGAVRNPFDRLVSWWGRDVSLPGFKDYIKETPTVQNTNESVYALWPFFTKLKSDLKDPISKDLFFIRFENLQEDFDTFCDKVNIPRQVLPHKNKSDHQLNVLKLSVSCLSKITFK
jgi:hypothetical protein